MAAPDPVLSVTDLHKSYGSVHALRGLSFDVPHGAFYGLFGRNGAGKTTTFDCVTGLLSRDRGRVSLLGDDFGFEPAPATKARFAYVGGHIALYQWMTLREHLDYVAGFYPTWDDARCAELLQTFRLPMHRPAFTLSPGMHLQFQLVMALAHHPELLIVDEPGNLDPVVRRRLMSTILEILEAEDATVLMASHLIDELEGACDHMCIIDRGRSLVRGPVRALVDRAREVHFRGAGAAELPVGEGVVSVKRIGPDLRVVLAVYSDEAADELAQRLHADSYETGRLSLEDFFIALTEKRGED